MLLVEQGYDVHRLMPDGLCFGHAVLAECVERHLLPSCRAALAAIDAGHACLALDRHMTAFNPARLDGLNPGCRAMLASVQVQITATAVERAAAGRTFLDP